MRRLTEYTVLSGRRTSWRRAASPTSTPSGVNATIDGRSVRPSASGITRGRPAVPSTNATRLLVVPRSMPTMRDMAFLALSQRLGEVVDDRREVRARRERLLARREHERPLAGVGGVPRGGERAGEARPPPPPGGGGRGPGRGAGAGGGPGGPPVAVRVEPAGLGLRERLLDLEHLLEQLRGRRRPDRRPLPRRAALLEPHQVLHARDPVAQRAVRGVQPRGGLERPRLRLGRRGLVEVGMPA